MTRYAVGDVQGCHEELKDLLGQLNFSWERDQIYFVGDLVNRGPRRFRCCVLFARSVTTPSSC